MEELDLMVSFDPEAEPVNNLAGAWDPDGALDPVDNLAGACDLDGAFDPVDNLAGECNPVDNSAGTHDPAAGPSSGCGGGKHICE